MFIRLVMLLGSLAGTALAAPVDSVPDSATLANAAPGQKIYGGTARSVPHSTAQAVEIATGIYRNTGFAKPIITNDGKVLYAFGETPPKVTVTPFQHLDIELAPDEKATSAATGDPARFKVELATGNVDHVVVTPKYEGLPTTLSIFTDKRSYYLRLVSKPTGFIPQIGWYYPQEIKTVQRFDRPADEPKPKGPSTLNTCMPAPGATANYDYSVDGPDELRPLYVADDGQAHTYIRMRPALQDAPTIVYRGADDRDQILNSRLVDGCYKLDRLADHFKLVLGDRTVEITRGRGG